MGGNRKVPLSVRAGAELGDGVYCRGPVGTGATPAPRSASPSRTAGAAREAVRDTALVQAVPSGISESPRRECR